jgi:hypothetical protein
MLNKLKPCTPQVLEIRENFKRDYKLSCPVIDDDDIFAKSLQIADLTSEWNDYLSMSLRHPDLNEYRKEVRNQITQHISSVKGFQEIPIQNYNYSFVGSRTYLENPNTGKKLVSIDLVKGNYQSLKHLGAQYVLGTETYEELIGKFTDEKCLISSKFFRQMVFGLLRPELQASVQKNLLAQLITSVFQIQQYPIISLSNDEVVLHVTGDSDLHKIESILTSTKTPIQYRLSLFRVEKIPNSYGDDWYVKYYIDSIDKYKCINSATTAPQQSKNKKRLMGIHVRYLMQVANFIEGNENTEKDFWWRERGRLCKLLEPERFGITN